MVKTASKEVLLWCDSYLFKQLKYKYMLPSHSEKLFSYK